MSRDQILCISYFDQVIGPSTLYCSEALQDISETPELGRILEFNEEEGTFIFAYRKYQTVNHIFYIDSELARGGKELMMITYMIREAIFKDEIVDVFKYLESKSSILEEFANEIKQLKGILPLLHLRKAALSEGGLISLANNELKTKFLDIFQIYFKRLTPIYKLDTPVSKKRPIRKVFILGPPRAGKRTFQKNIELIQFLKIKGDDLPTRIYEVIVENLEILRFYENTETFTGECFENFDECMYYAQGFILLFNASDKDSIMKTKKMFKIVDDKRLEMKGELVPVLIIGNKFHNKEEIKPAEIKQIFEIKELKQLGMRIRYFSINILKEDERIMKALRWLIKNMI